MVKCIVDGDVLELGGPNLLKLSYYSTPPKEKPILWKEVEELARNSKVVDELFDSKDIPRLKIVYIPCSDWSVRSEHIIKDLMDHFMDNLGDEYGRYPGKFCNHPKVITVVQDKDYWPGSELEDPLVLQRRAAKEKDFEKGLLQHKPDHKIVKNHVMFGSLINNAELFIMGNLNEEKKKKKKQLPRAQPYSLERYMLSDTVYTLFGCSIMRSPEDSDFKELEEEKATLPEELDEEEKASILEEIEVLKARGQSSMPGSWFFKGPTLEKCRARFQFIRDLKARKAAQSALKEKEKNKQFSSAQPLSQEKLSLKGAYPKKLVKDKHTLFTLMTEMKELPSAESSSFKRSRLDFTEDFLFDAPIPKKRRCSKTGFANKDKRAKKNLPVHRCVDFVEERQTKLPSAKHQFP